MLETGVSGYRSHFADRLRAVDARKVELLRVSPSMIALCDAVVSVCRVFTDDQADRPWLDRLYEMMLQRELDGDVQEWVEGLQALTSDDNRVDFGELMGRTSDTAYLQFARRLLGAAEYDRLADDLQHDAAVAVLAIRRGVRALMPLGVAWEDALGILTPEQLSRASLDDVLVVGVLRMLVELDQHLGEGGLPDLPMKLVGATQAELQAIDGADLVRLAGQFRPVVAEASQRHVDDVNSYLTRKLKGARQALQFSADGVSQAANSLIELVDRLFRETYPKGIVLDWLDAELPGEEGTTYLDKESGKRRPTKYAEALCFVYKGGTVDRPASDGDDSLGLTAFHRLTAKAIVQARNALQDLKHADRGQDDRDAVEKALAAIEGAVVIAMSVGWKAAQPRQPEVIDLTGSHSAATSSTANQSQLPRRGSGSAADIDLSSNTILPTPGESADDHQTLRSVHLSTNRADN